MTNEGCKRALRYIEINAFEGMIGKGRIRRIGIFYFFECFCLSKQINITQKVALDHLFPVNISEKTTPIIY